MKFFINVSSFYWILVFYCINNEYFIYYTNEKSKYISIALYILVGIILGYLSLKFLIGKSSKKSYDNLAVEKIYPVYTEYMPIYLAIIVIAFELNNFVDIQNPFTVYLLFILIFILFYISNIEYLNPVWYFLGYRVYKIENKKANYILIAYKKRNYKGIDAIKKIKKIDEFTFINVKE